MVTVHFNTTPTDVASLNINNTGAKSVVPQGKSTGYFNYQGFLYNQDITFIYNNNTYQPLAGMDYYYYYRYSDYGGDSCN